MKFKARDRDREDRLFLAKRALRQQHSDEQFVALSKGNEQQTAAPPSREQQAVAPPPERHRYTEKQTTAPPSREQQVVAPSLSYKHEKQTAAPLHCEQPAVAPSISINQKIRRHEGHRDSGRRPAAHKAAGRRYMSEQQKHDHTVSTGHGVGREDEAEGAATGAHKHILSPPPHQVQQARAGPSGSPTIKLQGAHSDEKRRSRTYICTEGANHLECSHAGLSLLMDQPTPQQGRSQRRRRRGGRRGDTRRAASKAAYEARMA